MHDPRGLTLGVCFIEHEISAGSGGGERTVRATYLSRRRMEAGRGNERHIPLTVQSGCCISLSIAQFGNRESVDVNRRSDLDHVVELCDVLVAQPDAPVTDRAANRLRFVGAMQGISVSQDEAMGAQDAFELALIGAEWRDQKVAA